MNDSDGEITDYMVLNDSKKRGRPVSWDLEQYQFFEKETKLNAMKCRFKTKKLLTAIKETDHIITTSDGKIVLKKIGVKTNKNSVLEKARRTAPANRSLLPMQKVQPGRVLPDT